MATKLNDKVDKALRRIDGVKDKRLRDIPSEVQQLLRQIESSNAKLAEVILSVIEKIAERPDPVFNVDERAIGAAVAEAIRALPQPKAEKAPPAAPRERKPVTYEADVQRDSRGYIQTVRLEPVGR